MRGNGASRIFGGPEFVIRRPEAGADLILLVLVGIFARQLQQGGRLGAAGFLTAFAGTAMLLLEGWEHLFSPDFGAGTPLGLWELIVTSLVFSVGYISLWVSRSPGLACCRGVPASC